MAARQPLRREPRAGKRAVALDGFVGIAGAARIKAAARAEHWAQGPLVDADEDHQDFSAYRYHCRVMLCQCFSRLARNALAGASFAASRAATVTSTLGSRCWLWRNDSRVKRFK